MYLDDRLLVRLELVPLGVLLRDDLGRANLRHKQHQCPQFLHGPHALKVTLCGGLVALRLEIVLTVRPSAGRRTWDFKVTHCEAVWQH